jgi:hypothetical protein
MPTWCGFDPHDRVAQHNPYSPSCRWTGSLVDFRVAGDKPFWQQECTACQRQDERGWLGRLRVLPSDAECASCAVCAYRRSVEFARSFKVQKKNEASKDPWPPPHVIVSEPEHSPVPDRIAKIVVLSGAPHPIPKPPILG